MFYPDQEQSQIQQAQMLRAGSSVVPYHGPREYRVVTSFLPKLVGVYFSSTAGDKSEVEKRLST